MGLPRFPSSAHREAILAMLLSSVTGAAITLLIYGQSKSLIFASGIIIALSLFFWRLRFRFIYGVIEVGFGLYVLWDASGKGRGGFSSGFSSGFDTFQLSIVLIQTLGAIYILIRGLDNLLQGLPEQARTKFEKRVREWQL